jgi:hypothetical protein
MPAAYKRVYQFKITLLDTTPLVWRRILVPETYTFYDFHVAIQDAMGWTDSHLHQFEVKRNHKYKGKDTRIVSIPVEGFEEETDSSSFEYLIDAYFDLYHKRCLYTYDFGDCWEHMIEVEELLDKTVGTKYPQCIEGENTCPPEDVGGIDGFERFKESMADPDHEEHDDFKMWYGKIFDLKEFTPSSVKFRKPSITMRQWFR